MSKEKQIKEMAEAIFQNCNCGLFFSEAEKIARFVIEEQGYRKQSEVANEIFDEIDNIIYNLRDSPFYSSSDAVYELTELKKKYTGEKEDEQVH